jgi:hypothetical protein
MTTDGQSRPRPNRLDRAFRSIQIVGAIAGVICLGFVPLGLVMRAPVPLCAAWAGFLALCLTSVLTLIMLATTYRDRMAAPPIRLWPYYLAIPGLILLLIVVSLLAALSNPTPA